MIGYWVNPICRTHTEADKKFNKVYCNTSTWILHRNWFGPGGRFTGVCRDDSSVSTWTGGLLVFELADEYLEGVRVSLWERKLLGPETVCSAESNNCFSVLLLTLRADLDLGFQLLAKSCKGIQRRVFRFGSRGQARQVKLIQSFTKRQDSCEAKTRKS